MAGRPRKVSGGWRIEVCVRRTRDSRTLPTRAAAQAWALEREIELRGGSGVVPGKTFAAACRRFAAELTPIRHRETDARNEVNRLDRLARSSLGPITLESMSISDGQAWITAELARGVSADTVIRESVMAKVVLRQAVTWSWLGAYPWTGLKLPAAGRARERLPHADEIQRLVIASGLDRIEQCETYRQETIVAFLIGCESAMRLGEIMRLTRRDVDLTRRVARVVRSKTGPGREVPLSSEACRLFARVPERGERWFGVSGASASTIFRTVCRRAEVEGLRFHDSRAAGATSLSKRLDVYQLARAMGITDLKRLMTYYRERAEDMAQLLD